MTTRRSAISPVTMHLNNGQVTMNVVNRHLDREMEAEIEIQDGAFKGSFEVHLVTGPDIKAKTTSARLR
jgi:alpha-L-arabinofuranosidase